MARPRVRLPKNFQHPVARFRVGEIMSSPVIMLYASYTVEESMRILIQREISGAPVVDQNRRLITVVSEIDLMKFAVLGGSERPLSDYFRELTPPNAVITVRKEEKFLEAFRELLVNPVRRVVVVDVTGKVQGIVSRRNILRAVLKAEG